MSTKTVTSAAAIVGAALVGSLAFAPLANAADNPFAAKSLDSGYLQLASSDKAEGEGKCGGETKEGEGKCGEGKDKKEGEGKCGEGKCGGAK